MSAVVFYFQVHQPFRVRRYGPDDVGRKHDYFDDGLNSMVMKRVAERCYVPMNTLLRELIDRTDGRFRCSFSISGTALDQMQQWAPQALQSFVTLAETGNVEFLCETSHHSLAFDGDVDEFCAQVTQQRDRVERLFGKAPRTFRNTELVIDEKVAKTIEDLGFDTLMGEGADGLLKGKSPCFLYRPRGCSRLNLMLRHYPLSDDIGFRFSNRKWPGYPLFADNFAGWLHEQALSREAGRDVQFIGLYIDYETFGEHQWAETGIIDFMRHLPSHVLAKGVEFATPSEIAAEHQALGELPIELSIARPFSWADQERDLSAWLGNPMQREAHALLYAMLPDVRAADAKGHHDLMADWRKLTTSDHVYYMCTKFASDGDVHEYFSPFDSPHDAFLNFVYALDDLRQRVTRAASAKRQPTKRDQIERTILPLRDQLGSLQQDRRDLHRDLQQGQDHG